MDSSQFSANQSHFESIEQMESQGATCDTFRVKVYGKLHFLKRLKLGYAGDIRYQEAFRKEFETGYRLEHPNLVRYISLTDDGILMEYVDGRTLSQLIANDPDYFREKKHTDKFVRQLLGALGYLHSHQVLHLDLKPDNILLTHINKDVKLIDLGFCYTDTFADTQGHTNNFASPEQLSGEKADVRSDIYAFGKVVEQLPDHTIYNKVIARCTAERAEDRYQSVDEILYDINHQRRYYRYLSLFVALVAVLAICIVLFTHQQTHRQEAAPMIQQSSTDSVVPIQRDTIVMPDTKPAPPPIISHTDELSESQRLEIRHYALGVIRPVYNRMIVPIVNRINEGEYDGRIQYVQDSLAKVYVSANEEVRAVFRKDAIEKRYPHVSSLEVSEEENNIIGDVMNYYDQLIMHHQYPGVKIPPNPFEE